MDAMSRPKRLGLEGGNGWTVGVPFLFVRGLGWKNEVFIHCLV